MTSAGDRNTVAEALDYLRRVNQFFEFDNRERVVKVAIYDAVDADEIAAHVGQLRDLQNLIFSGTDLTDRGLRHLAGLVRLRRLWINGERFTAEGLQYLGAMSRLKRLTIENKHELGRAAIECVARITSLRELNLSDGPRRDVDLAPLQALVNLEDLCLEQNPHVDGTYCEHLVALTKLRTLSAGIGITDAGLDCIARLANLDTLLLEGSFTDTELGQIRSLKQLEKLYIYTVSAQQITPQGLAVVTEIPTLRDLNLRITPLTDAFVPVLARCRWLTSLYLMRSDLTDAGRRQIREALPDCEFADFSAPQDEDDQPSSAE